ncbi:MAG: hypothetical protein KatS3mg011_0231 [Acidimicrobiia bacterium]|jgi:HSP20 family protein|nr:MAG: hypothetical protein KatS3mg011_0231 [Acidimicrobiia bacterium]
MLMRFDPFAELDRVTREWGTRGVVAMPVDAYRLGDRYFLHFDLPGVDPESIDITVDKNTLTVTAERRWEVPQEAEVVIAERRHGTFSRSFYLGEGLDQNGIEAGYDHGVLTVSIPLADQAKPKRIVVESKDKALRR